MLRTILLLSLLFGCQTGRGGAHSATKPAAEDVPPDTVITLERTLCYGSCPSYKVTVYADGRVVYEGKQFVKVTGVVNDTITREQVKQLLAEFERADYFSLRDTYEGAEDGCPTGWTDNPSARTSIQLAGSKKAISHYYGCREKDEGDSLGGVFPKKLYDLESRIDEILNTARWVKGGAKGNPQQ